MRVEDNGIYRKSQTRDFEKRYFIAFEGFTEYAYFLGLKQNKTDPAVRISRKIDIQCLSRFDQNAGDSNPIKIEEAMADYKLLIREGHYTVRLFVSTIVQEIYLHLCGSMKKTDKKRCRNALHNLQTELISKLYCTDFVKRDMVIDTAWDEATIFCKDQIDEGRFSGYGKYVKVPKDRKIDTYDEKNDFFCLVVDRDVSSNPTKKYRELLATCSKERVKLYVTNPCFEFWLILHFPESLKLGETEYGKIRSNEKIQVGIESSRTYCETTLLKFDPDYTKTTLDFKDRYMGRLSDALEHAESFETDLNRLEDHIGSNVGELIKELRSG